MMSTFKEKIRNYFFSRDVKKLSDSENLFDSGLLDSFGVVEFTSFLEDVFDISLEIDDMTMDNFKNINSIAKLIEKCKKK